MVVEEARVHSESVSKQCEKCPKVCASASEEILRVLGSSTSLSPREEVDLLTCDAMTDTSTSPTTTSPWVVHAPLLVLLHRIRNLYTRETQITASIWLENFLVLTSIHRNKMVKYGKNYVNHKTKLKSQIDKEG